MVFSLPVVAVAAGIMHVPPLPSLQHRPTILTSLVAAGEHKHLAATLILITPRPFWVLVAGPEPGLAAASPVRQGRLLEIQQFLAETAAMDVFCVTAVPAETVGTAVPAAPAIQEQELHREVVVVAAVFLVVAVTVHAAR